MALFLEISRSQVSYIEHQKRSETELIKSKLEVFYPLLFTTIAEEERQKSIAHIDTISTKLKLKKTLDTKKLSLRNEEKNLKLLRASYINIASAIHSLKKMISHETSMHKKAHPVWIQQLNRLEAKVLLCDHSQQEILRIKIEGIKAEIAAFEKVV